MDVHRIRTSLTVLSIAALSATAWGAPLRNDPQSRTPLRFSDYRFEFSVLPDTIIPNQRIWFRLRVTNLTVRTVPSPYPVSVGGWYAIHGYVDEAGRPMPIPVLSGSWGGTVSSGELPPGKSAVHCFDLGSQVWDWFRPANLTQAMVGHTIRLVVTLNRLAFIDEPGLDSALADRYVPFVTIPAQGDEIAAATAFQHADSASFKQGDPSPAPLWRDFITRYPNSRLVESALGKLYFLGEDGMVPKKTPTQVVLSLIKETIERRPGSMLIVNMIHRLKRGPEFTDVQYDSLRQEIEVRRPDSPALEALKPRR